MSNKSWKIGDKVSIGEPPVSIEVGAGLFVYSGFGLGNYYGRDFTVTWCSPEQAYELAQKDNITMCYKDGLFSNKEYWYPTRASLEKATKEMS